MPTAYQLNNVSFRYGDFTALSIAFQQIPAHQITALIGPNGSGKSTLLNLLAFLYKPTAGQVRFFDEIVTEQRFTELRRRIAYLPQKPYLFKGTVEDNLKMAMKFHGLPDKLQQSRNETVLRRLDIQHLGQQKTHMLSGGELQKAALARAIVTDPKVLLLDEPFSYLDNESAQLLEQFILDYSQDSGKTLIFSTHNRLRGLAITDHVLSLVQGKLVDSNLINVFHGHYRPPYFHSDKLSIYLPDVPETCRHISIDPHEIVLSVEALESSMRNSFRGQIGSIAEEKGLIRVTVHAGEVFHALITQKSLQELKLHPGLSVWVNFKSSAVMAI